METWYEVMGYAGAYSVSTDRRVRNNNTGKILKPNVAAGPVKVNLYNEFTGMSCAHVIDELLREAAAAAKRTGVSGKTGSHFES